MAFNSNFRGSVTDEYGSGQDGSYVCAGGYARDTRRTYPHPYSARYTHYSHGDRYSTRLYVILLDTISTARLSLTPASLPPIPWFFHRSRTTQCIQIPTTHATALPNFFHTSSFLSAFSALIMSYVYRSVHLCYVSIPPSPRPHPTYGPHPTLTLCTLHLSCACRGSSRCSRIQSSPCILPVPVPCVTCIFLRAGIWGCSRPSREVIP
ncbi:hypothetical protein DENSPDRAFT_556486 [Dentipellis sp. KUC8613]|nr:hypothetical protein DENSPDRAFT_556486 [Dentipellis sp. KUC8613]